MAQHDFDIANQSGSSFRSDLNNCLDAIQSQNSGSSAPSSTVAFMPWADTNANLIKFRNAANDGFITLCATDGTFPAKTFTGDVTLNAQSDLRFADSDSSNFVALQAPGTISTSYTLTLPAADGTSGQALVTDGSGTLSFSTAGGGDISSTAPDRTFTNTTQEDTDGGRESKITFKGEQSGGEVSTLAQIRAEHDGTADDEKGQLVFKTNDGNDGSSPTTRLTIDSAGKSFFGADLDVNELTLGRGPVGSNTNTCFGNKCLEDNTTGGNGGIENTVMGYRAGLELTTGAGNTLIGAYCGKDGVLTGQYNTCMGWQAAEDLSTGDNNVCIGREAGAALTTGDSNVFIGDRSGYYQPDGAITGVYNVCIGLSTGASFSGASNNVCIGRSAGGNMTTPQTNTCVGMNAGLGLIGGGGNVLLGYNAGYTGSPSGNLQSTDYQVVLGNDAITDLWCADTSISSSDQRDKADITDFTHGLDWVTQMRPVTYKWDKRSWYVDWEANPDTDLREVTTDGTHKKDRVNIGLLAQEVQTIEQADGFASNANNELLSRTTDDGQSIGVKYERIVPVLINAIKELKTANDALTARVAALEAA